MEKITRSKIIIFNYIIYYILHYMHVYNVPGTVYSSTSYCIILYCKSTVGVMMYVQMYSTYDVTM